MPGYHIDELQETPFQTNRVSEQHAQHLIPPVGKDSRVFNPSASTHLWLKALPRGVNSLSLTHGDKLLKAEKKQETNYRPQ